MLHLLRHGHLKRIAGMALRASLMVLVGVLACAVLGDARGQSVTNGKTLYRAYCQVCHSPDPSTAVPPFNLIMTAANNPGQITIAASSYPSQMGFITTTFSASDLADLAAYIGTFLSAPAIVPVVEFYNAGHDHYFISSSTSEIADLDQGVHPGWARTGLGFNAYSGPASTTSPVCRFYIPPAYGDSHFYSASPTECAQVLAKFPYFVYEAANVFYIDLPDTTTGICPTGDIAVYRVWDNRADTNHRYTTSTAVVDQMRGRGWIAEGYGPGPYYPIMCAPQWRRLAIAFSAGRKALSPRPPVRATRRRPDQRARSSAASEGLRALRSPRRQLTAGWRVGFLAPLSLFLWIRPQRLLTAIALFAALFAILKAYHGVVFAATLYST